MPTSDDVLEIALIRHGRTDWNIAGRLQGRMDIPLNAEGRSDAAGVAERLATQSWHALYASPLSRALNTAKIIGERSALEIRIKACLVERSYGAIEGKTLKELRRKRSPRGDGSELIEGMESDAVLQARARRCMETLLQEHAKGRIVVVSHGGFINALLFSVSNGRIGTGITRLANGSITRLVWHPRRAWDVLSLNETSHLVKPQEQTDRKSVV